MKKEQGETTIRKEITKLLVKHDMPTRQAFINQLFTLFPAPTKEIRECETCGGTGFVGGAGQYSIGKPCPVCSHQEEEVVTGALTTTEGLLNTIEVLRKTAPQDDVEGWEIEFDEKFMTRDIKGGITNSCSYLCCSEEFCTGHVDEIEDLKSFIKSLLSQNQARVVEIIKPLLEREYLRGYINGGANDEEYDVKILEGVYAQYLKDNPDALDLLTNLK